MDNHRGLDFLVGLVVGALIMFLGPLLLNRSSKKLLVATVKPIQVAEPPTQLVQSPQLNPYASDKPAKSANPTKAAKIKLPLLPPPKFASNLPKVLYSDAKGQVALAWVPVENARRYQVQITDNNGHRIQLSGWVHTNVSLTRLPPPAPDESERIYWVEIATQNKDQVAGAYGDKRKIIYLGKALSTPKIESIQVEE